MIPMPAPFAQIIRVLIIVIVVLVVVYIIAGLLGAVRRVLDGGLPRLR